MKKLLLISLIVLGSIYNITVLAKGNPQPLDKMIAIVNDDVISRSELNHELETTKMQLTQEHTAQPPASVLQKQVLDQLINKKIQLQIAKQAGVEVTDKELNTTVARIAAQNQMSVEALYERINDDGMNKEEYRKEMRDQMTMQRLQQQEVASKMSVSPQEITNFIQSKAWQTNGAKEYHLQDLLVPLSENPSAEEIINAKSRADDVVAKLKQGGNFDQIAMTQSEGSQALQGGDLGWRKLPEIPTAFANQVVKMQSNTTAGPIQTGNGFHIIRLVEARTLTGKQAATSRKMIESLLLQQKFETAVRDWVSKLRSQAFVVVNV